MVDTERDADELVSSVSTALHFGGRRPCVEDFIETAMGPRGMALAPLPVAQSALALVGGEWTIFVDPRLPPDRMRWQLAHHFSEWVLRTEGVSASELVRLRSPVAAELLLPRHVAARAVGRVSFVDLARKLVVPTASMLLREAEVARVPTALLGQGARGKYGRVRGDDDGRLPLDVHALELLASHRGIGVQKFAVPEEGGVIIRLAA